VKASGPHRRGIAVIVVVLMIAIIVPATVQLNRTTRSRVYEASHMGNAIRAQYAAKSGFNMGQALLLAQKGSFDALTQDWANLGETSALSESLFDNARFQVLIDDEIGKIPLNRLVVNNEVNPDVREMLVRLLSLPEFRLGPEKVTEIVNALKDWMDTDDEATGAGAETAYYRTLERPYAAKNGAMENMEELLMIKGVTKSLYYGTKETPALSNCLTLHGLGKININTAPKLVLRVLAAEMTPEMAEEMDAYRRNPQNDLSDPAWFRRINSMASISVNLNWIITRSDRFRIQSTGYTDNTTETVSGIVYRDESRKTLKLVSWKAY
jgi:general secretion pathway protein K